MLNPTVKTVKIADLKGSDFRPDKELKKLALILASRGWEYRPYDPVMVKAGVETAKGQVIPNKGGILDLIGGTRRTDCLRDFWQKGIETDLIDWEKVDSDLQEVCKANILKIQQEPTIQALVYSALTDQEHNELEGDDWGKKLHGRLELTKSVRSALKWRPNLTHAALQAEFGFKGKSFIRVCKGLNAHKSVRTAFYASAIAKDNLFTETNVREIFDASQSAKKDGKKFDFAKSVKAKIADNKKPKKPTETVEDTRLTLEALLEKIESFSDPIIVATLAFAAGVASKKQLASLDAKEKESE